MKESWFSKVLLRLGLMKVKTEEDKKVIKEEKGAEETKKADMFWNDFEESKEGNKSDGSEKDDNVIKEWKRWG